MASPITHRLCTVTKRTGVGTTAAHGAGSKPGASGTGLGWAGGVPLSKPVEPFMSPQPVAGSISESGRRAEAGQCPANIGRNPTVAHQSRNGSGEKRFCVGGVGKTTHMFRTRNISGGLLPRDQMGNAIVSNRAGGEPADPSLTYLIH